MCFLILFQVLLHAQTTDLNKAVKLPSGQITLKAALKMLSDQSGCVFSYDPTKILDNQMLTISSNAPMKFQVALKEILPKHIQFKLKGKYVILQKSVAPTAKALETLAKETKSQQKKSTQRPSTVESRLDKDPEQVRLVLPPFEPVSDDTKVKQIVDTINPVDSIAMNLQKNQVFLLSTPADTVPVQQAVAEVKQTTELPSALIIKSGTMTAVKPGFVDFIKKRGVLDTELAVNSRLTAVSVHAGVYGIYSILSIGYDFNNSYSLGIGIGTSIKLNKNVGLNMDLVRHSLLSGKSYNLGVRTKLTQFSPEFYYSVGNSLKFFGGPTVQVIKASYINSIPITDLGRTIGFGIILGVKVDLKNLLMNQ